MKNDPVQFFLACDLAAKHFYSVEIYPTQGMMQQAIADLKGCTLRSTKDDEAVCLRYDVKTSTAPAELRGKHKLIGTIFFYRGGMPVSTVVHELTHAAVGWAKKARVNPLKRSASYTRCPEEKFARCVEYLTAQFYQHAPRALTK